MALSVETLFPSPKETMCDKHLWEARDFSRVRLHRRCPGVLYAGRIRHGRNRFYKSKECGEGFFRLSTFGSLSDTKEAAARMIELLK